KISSRRTICHRTSRRSGPAVHPSSLPVRFSFRLGQKTSFPHRPSPQFSLLARRTSEHPTWERPTWVHPISELQTSELPWSHLSLGFCPPSNSCLFSGRVFYSPRKTSRLRRR